jgi:hypothetical protein
MKDELYTIHRDVAEELDATGASPVMLYAFDGFVDAGIVAGVAINDLVTREGSRRLVTFNTDELVDYRSRRPPMVYSDAGWTGYMAPELGIDLVHDAKGQPFLLMYGPEPDLRWEAFAQAVIEVVEHFDVRLAVGMHGLSMPVPHTRPLAVTGPGQVASLTNALAGHRGAFQVPGSAMGLVEYRLKEISREAVTYAVHVPTYLSSMPYPEGTVRLLEAIEPATGLTFDLDNLRVHAVEAKRAIDRQVADSEELSQAVAGLEERYDSVVTEGRTGQLPSGPLPTGDELAQELERFLADQSAGTDGPDTPSV